MKKIIVVMASLIVSACIDTQDHSLCDPELEVRSAQPGFSDEFASILESAEKLDLDVVEGSLIEGDIFIPSGTYPPTFLAGPQPKSAVFTGRLWENGVVYYTIAEDVKRQYRLYRAMEIWETATGGVVSFVERTDEPNYVEIIANDPQQCWSFVGMRGGQQFLNLGDLCTTSTAVHELGHTLGLWHEQSRNDRDGFVAVQWCNIAEDIRFNFGKQASRLEDVGPYDYRSIMHYGSHTFTLNLFPTLKSLTDTPVSFIPAMNLSEGDVNGVLALYATDE